MLKTSLRPTFQGGAAFGIAYKDLMPSLRNAWNSEAYDEDKRANSKVYAKTAAQLAASDMSTPIPPLRLRAVLGEVTQYLNKILEDITQAESALNGNMDADLSTLAVNWNELVAKANPLLIGPVNVGMSDADTNALHSLISNQLEGPLERLQTLMAEKQGQVTVVNGALITSPDIQKNILMQVIAKYYKPVPFEAGPAEAPGPTAQNLQDLLTEVQGQRGDIRRQTQNLLGAIQQQGAQGMTQQQATELYDLFEEMMTNFASRANVGTPAAFSSSLPFTPPPPPAQSTQQRSGFFKKMVQGGPAPQGSQVSPISVDPGPQVDSTLSALGLKKTFAAYTKDKIRRMEGQSSTNLQRVLQQVQNAIPSMTEKQLVGIITKTLNLGIGSGRYQQIDVPHTVKGKGKGWTDYTGPTCPETPKKSRGGSVFRDTPMGQTARRTRVTTEHDDLDYNDEENDIQELGGVAQRSEMLMTENREEHLNPDWKGLPKRWGIERRYKKLRRGYSAPKDSY